MTTTTQSFVYRQRSRESVEHVLRLHQPAWDWDQSIRLAYHGEPARLCALLRADGLDDLADLLEWVRPPRRRIPPSVDAFDLEGHVRRHEKRYGKRDSNGEFCTANGKTAWTVFCGHSSKWMSCR
jgi:hypothetical protein